MECELLPNFGMLSSVEWISLTRVSWFPFTRIQKPCVRARHGSSSNGRCVGYSGLGARDSNPT